MIKVIDYIGLLKYNFYDVELITSLDDKILKIKRYHDRKYKLEKILKNIKK